MPRLARVDIGNEIYHVINRANNRAKIFHNAKDYQLFERLMIDAKEITDMRIISYTIMPNHWHLVLYPRKNRDLGLFMHRLTNAHTRQVRTYTNSVGTGHLYQGRYKSFIVQTDSYYFSLIKYVERNPVRAGLTKRCEDWQWGSAWHRSHNKAHQILCTPPIPLPDDHLEWINEPENEDNLESIRHSVNKGTPYGKEEWVAKTVSKHNLISTLRKAGRPKKIN